MEILRLHFNHADETTTRRYIGIDEEERNRNLRRLQAGDFRPEKAEHATRRKGKASAELEIDRLDREENGRKWGESKKEAARRAKEKEKREKQRKKEKAEYDRKRYLQKKAAREAAQEAEKRGE